MIVLDAADVKELLRFSEVIPLMREVLVAFSTGGVTQPLRTVVRPQGQETVLGSMPAHLDMANHAGFGIKAVIVKPDNATRGLDTHLGVVIVYDPDTGLPAALMDAAAVTAVRTAAVSAVATDLLAAPDADDLALVGAGAQARAHLQAISEVRALRRVRIWSRTGSTAQQFARWAEKNLSLRVEPQQTVTDAVAGADIVCTLTSSNAPVLAKDQIREGAHVNAVGACFPHARELATDVVEKAAVFVDSRQSAMAEAGDLLMPIQEGRFCENDIRAELGEVLAGRLPGRMSPVELTIFESLGIAAEDVAAGLHLAEVARAQGRGTRVEVYGGRS